MAGFRMLVVAVALSAANAVASPVTYDFASAPFDTVTGSYTTSDRITGSIAFDDSSLVGGTGVIYGDYFTPGPVGGWSFTDGHITVSRGDFVTTPAGGTYIYGWMMELHFSSGQITEWHVDTTNGRTNPDVWSYNLFGCAHSEAGDAAGYTNWGSMSMCGSPAVLAAAGQWTLHVAQQAVPEPASLALLGLGFAGLGFSRRRSA